MPAQGRTQVTIGTIFHYFQLTCSLCCNQGLAYSVVTFTPQPIWAEKQTREFVRFRSSTHYAHDPISTPSAQLLAFHCSLCRLLQRTAAAPVLDEAYKEYTEDLLTQQSSRPPTRQEVFRTGINALLSLGKRGSRPSQVSQTSETPPDLTPPTGLRHGPPPPVQADSRRYTWNDRPG